MSVPCHLEWRCIEHKDGNKERQALLSGNYSSSFIHSFINLVSTLVVEYSKY